MQDIEKRHHSKKNMLDKFYVFFVEFESNIEHRFFTITTLEIEITLCLVDFRGI